MSNLSIGEKMSLEDMIYGLMMQSGNDAALMIADFLGGEDAFVEKMNKPTIPQGDDWLIPNRRQGRRRFEAQRRVPPSAEGGSRLCLENPQTLKSLIKLFSF